MSIIISMLCLGINTVSMAVGATQQLLPVEVLELKPVDWHYQLTTLGTAYNALEVDIKSKVSGYITQQLQEDGACVEANAALFNLDTELLQLNFDQSAANLSLQEAKYSQAHLEFKRISNLEKEKALSQADLDLAKSALDQAAANVLSAKVASKIAKLNLDQATIRAPFKGCLAKANFSLGKLITANLDNLISIHSIKPIFIDLHLTNDEVSKLSVKDKLDANFSLVNNNAIKGQMIYLANGLNKNSSQRKITLSFDNDNLPLIAGQIYKIRLASKASQSKIILPQTAVIKGQNGYFVFKVSPEGIINKQDVQVEAWEGPNWVVSEGLNSGELVANSQVLKLGEGMPVKIVKPSKPVPIDTKP